MRVRSIALLVGLFGSVVHCAAAPTTSSTPKAGSPEDSTTEAPVEPPDDFAKSEVDVVSVIRSDQDRLAISPLIFGINKATVAKGAKQTIPNGVTFVRRGGDRANTYNWETNLSTASIESGVVSDLYLAAALDNPNEPAALDLALIREDRAANRGTMVPFVLHDWVAATAATNIPYDQDGFDRSQYFHRVGLVKPTAFAATPDLGDGMVYTDEHLVFMKKTLGEDIYKPGPTQVIVGIDNEPDLYAYNFPMLQEGSGAALSAENGTTIGHRITGAEFTARFLQFVTRVKELEPEALIVGPSHYHFDGFTSWHGEGAQYDNRGDGHWYMDDFLATVKTESEQRGKRLLDTWDFHWYPQHQSDGKYVWDLDDSVRKLTDVEIQDIVQGPRSYWDTEYDERSWITQDHLGAPASILARVQKRIDAAYPGTKLGVSEYFPGGCAHISSGLAIADSLGVFARMGVHLAAMWPTCTRLEYAHGAFSLLRDADGKGAKLGDTSIKVEHPEKAESSVYAATNADKLLTVLVINKTTNKRTFGLRAFHSTKLSRVSAYRIDADHASPTASAEATLTKKNAYAYEAPPLSAALLVFH